MKLYDFDYEPNILIADSAPAITNGFTSVFKDLIYRVNCSVHALRNIQQNRLKQIKPQELQNKIYQQLLLIQSSFNKEIFEKSQQLFLRLYQNSTNPQVKSLCEYLQDNWFKSGYDSWYEGYCVGKPSHSNNIESFHLNKLKNKNKIKERPPANQYLIKLKEVVKDWSKYYTPQLFDSIQNSYIENPNLYTYKNKPVYTNSELLKAYEYQKKNMDKICIKLNIEGQHIYFLPSGEEKQLTKDQCREYLLRIKDCNFTLQDKNNHPKHLDKFDQFFVAVNKIRMVKLNLQCWEQSECNCNFWNKNYKCFHIVLCAFRETKCKFNFDDILLLLPCEKKKSRGAKSKSKPALLRQSLEHTTATNVILEENQNDSTTNDSMTNFIEDDIVVNKENQPPSKKQKINQTNQMNSSLSKKQNIQTSQIASSQLMKCPNCNQVLSKARYFYCRSCSKK